MQQEDKEFDFLVRRANYFMEFLELYKIDKIFPNRKASNKELKERIQSGSVRRMRIFDNIINNLIIGKNSLTKDEQLNALNFLKEKMGEDGIAFIDEKLKLYNTIKKRGFIKSRLEILDAIEIMNSFVLGLSNNDKKELKEIKDLDIRKQSVKENNKKINTVAEAALESDATIVSMQELKETSFAIVDEMMRKNYPYVFSDLTVPGFGMAVYSKYPFIQQEVLKQNDFPILSGAVKIGNDTLHFLAATTSTPTNEKGFDKQSKQFKFIAEEANKIKGPLVVMGDMNAAPWSEHIEGLLANTKLKDSRKDLSATYPAQSPVQIPIDYIFHSPEITCAQFVTQGGTTSNHLGLKGTYTFRDTNKKKTKN